MRGKYETYIVPYLAEIKQWARLGIEEREIARKLGVAAPTFSGYKKKHPELRDAVRDGRQDAVLTLKNKLFEVAAGKATTTTVKTYTTVDKDGSTRKHVDKIVVQHPPSVPAIQILLKNWDSEWFDKPAEVRLKREEFALKRRLAEQSSWAMIDLDSAFISPSNKPDSVLPLA